MNQELISLCMMGDSRAQQLLYEQLASRMFRVCYRYLKEEWQAEEALIKGFLKVFQNLRQFEYRGEASLEAWVKRIMVNEALMFLRKKHPYNLLTETQADSMESGLAPDTDLHAEEIYALILQLPTGYRTVFNLYVIEGYSHQEIAKQLKISENTSKSQLSKAKATLRYLLTKHGITHEN